MKGYYLGDWRNIDVEGVRQVIILLTLPPLVRKQSPRPAHLPICQDRNSRDNDLPPFSGGL